MSRFDDFWEQWPKGPRKVNKKGCREKWNAKKFDESADVIIEHVRWSARNNKQWKGGFAPMPMTYLNQERWEDGTFEEKPKRAEGFVAESIKPDDIQNYVIKNRSLTLNQVCSRWAWIQSRDGGISGCVIPDDPETGAPGFRFMASEMLSEGV